MAKFLNKFLITTGAQTGKNKFDLSCNHITTQDFYKMKCVYHRELIPGQTIEIKSSVFSRLAPLGSPFFGRADIITRSFFVPYRTIMEGFNDFITGAPHQYASGTKTIISTVPTVTNDVLINAFVGDTTLSEAGSSDDYDFFYAPSGSSAYYKLTALGRIFWDILQSLGYKLNSFNGSASQVDTTILSALPLLAWCKVYDDCFQNPAYLSNTAFQFLFKGVPVALTAANVRMLLRQCYTVFMHSDYFTSAWDNPVGPNDNVESSFGITDVTNENSNTAYHAAVGTVATANGTPSIGSNPNSSTKVPSSATVNTLTQYILDTLKHVTDYVKRHQMLGSRALDRYMGEYGIQLDSAKLDRSMYLGKGSFQCQISDVMQTANDTDSVDGVGNYRGKGVCGGSDVIKFKTDEFGMFMIISYIVPHVSYVDGRDRILQHLTKFDFFTPEFDGLGTQAIRFDELSTNVVTPINQSSPSDIFGFTPRYAEHKVALDQLTGDFTFNTKNTDIRDWYLARRYDGAHIAENSLQTQHNLAFCQGDPNDWWQIFVDQTSNNDHFYSVFSFDVTSFMPARPLYDSFDFHSAGKKLLMSINGTSAND